MEGRGQGKESAAGIPKAESVASVIQSIPAPQQLGGVGWLGPALLSAPLVILSGSATTCPAIRVDTQRWQEELGGWLEEPVLDPTSALY